MPARWLRSAVLVLASMTLFACSPQADVPTPTATSETTATTTPPPTPEELAADAAMTAFTELLRVTDAASQDPGAKDWEPDIRQYAGDPYASATVQSIRDYVTLGIRQVGDTEFTAEVAGVDLASLQGPTVLLTVCYDSTSADLIQIATGEPIPSGTPPKYVLNVKVIQFQLEPGEPWLVSVVEPLTDQPC